MAKSPPADPRIPVDADEAFRFLQTLFAGARHPIRVQSLANDRGDRDQPGMREVSYRDRGDRERIINFLEQWNMPGRGMFVCVGTVSKDRRKENILETVGLHTDIDYKGIEHEGEQWVIDRVTKRKFRPTLAVRSGHGLHCYWLFAKAIDAQENLARTEALLRRLSDYVAGDPQVCEISRLMRLPGTHNTKYLGDRVPVRILYDDGPRYTIEELEEWLGDERSAPRQKPLLQRRAGPLSAHSGAPLTSSTDPFTRLAQEQGYAPPIDVDAVLKAMTHGNVHDTQIRCSAALIERGMAVDEVVDRLLTATKALPDTAGWDWRREHRDLHTMCLSWLNKHPRETANAATTKPPTSSDEPPQPRKTKPKKSELHAVLGQGVLDTLEERKEWLLCVDKLVYWYRDGLWQRQDPGMLKSRFDAEVERGCQQLSITSNNKLCGEALGWVLRQGKLRDDSVRFDAHRKVSVIGGLIDPLTGTLEPSAPGQHTTWRIERSYNPDARCPMWLQLLKEVFADRSADEFKKCVGIIQELFGLGMIDRRSKALSRALLFEGQQDTGKTTLLRILCGIFGNSVHSTALARLDENHGTMAFLSCRVWRLDEAFNDGRWVDSATIKSIISGDPIDVNIKHRDPVSITVTGPIFWSTNHPAAIKETTGAIAERIVIIHCAQTFSQHIATGVGKIALDHGYDGPADLILETEGDGLLVWGIEGLRRALQRHHLVLPEESTKAASKLQRQSNVAIDFFARFFDYDPDSMVSIADVNAMYRAYLEAEHDIEKGRIERLRKSIPNMPNANLIAVDDDDLRDNGRRFYCGVRVNENGLELIDYILDPFRVSKKPAGVSESRQVVNCAIPASWGVYGSIKKMRRAHVVFQGKSSQNGSGSGVSNPMTGSSQVLSRAVTDDKGMTKKFDDLSSTQAAGRSKKTLF